MASIKKVFAYEIIDSRGFPTIEARLWLDDDREVVTSIPAGTSVGKYEALELRDADTQRFRGMGVLRAVNIINELIAPKLVGVSPTKQSEVDHWLAKADGSKKKEKLGANSILAVSQLFVKAAALSESIPLHAYVNKLYKRLFKNEIKVEKIPTPIFNIINGGKHANNNLEFQEFQILPSSSFSFSKAYQIGVEVFHELKEVLAYRNANISVGEEGGFSPSLSSNVDAIEVLVEALNRKNLRPGVDIFVGLDIAASHFYKNDRYVIKEINHPMSKEEFIQYLVDLTRKYAFLTLEDPLDQDDFDGWKKLLGKISNNIYLVGDDLLATNKERFLKAIKEKACTTILVKPNQIGTITETLEVIDIARKNNINYVVSHRSGETNDSFIADFAVGVQADFVKFGAPSRGERVAKYNRLWQIEREELKQTK
ncbi:phosphopyruvate hydratase [Candidatus Roizmanbacteria bacterium RIFCSPLOWO2_12_FULL_40_12]|uniref:Enolase n=1 Tax=Candidatus Roizmanbacteria bacterium RIFCSPLOWO2_01_FULL_40_42 TaxID=1802066 RepID=A0A1F7J2C3_9BACT|nr:MAG: phosphopyruvate hydratase [Candidatus Roizmanbacteria bacterium RIFCSPHIGHO2_01_FULL_40_98]OGK27749.1 MAG: phosphopyruvate hydratase [Candidatus Roizmanbacteria bacterium RIFCSPHIGHO2_02_FULL_40_53]OGK30674.1 MAG: phosphopyruvate hydratase [Candidatus Roizmanbacteria bacterium RIFCSPHIGHO2_12_41_18]OGK36496.1 MAG: phosphopyruvate hydratase [Candidatus Roizmanbacteria bacterium RIFCSPHIGHO2_12_FULL_40_130]OGK49758.1 MAG: phosphopyruvate hydratase [Candidatus Roizmanbacteria bacterium RIF